MCGGGHGRAGREQRDCHYRVHSRQSSEELPHRDLFTSQISFYSMHGLEISPHLAEAASFSRMSCAEGPHHALGLKELHDNPEKMVSLSPRLFQQVSSQRPSRKTCKWPSKTCEWPPEDKQVAHGQTAQAEWTPKPDPVMFHIITKGNWYLLYMAVFCPNS